MSPQLVLANQAALHHDPFSFDAAIADWTLCNMYAGCRDIEWAQTSTTQATIGTHHRNRFGNAYAFTLADVQCQSATHARLTINQALLAPSLVGIIKLRFEEQKNNDNGEWKLFVRNNENAHLCFVTSFLRILDRYNNLIGASEVLPLSIYRSTPLGASKPAIFNITTALVEVAIRSAAAQVYNLDPIKNRRELQLWSSHSLRVGACATLYAKGFSEMEIKFLLRWKSNAFMTYLRNLAITSRRHNAALNDISQIPNFV